MHFAFVAIYLCSLLGESGDSHYIAGTWFMLLRVACVDRRCGCGCSTTISNRKTYGMMVCELFTDRQVLLMLFLDISLTDSCVHIVPVVYIFWETFVRNNILLRLERTTS